MRFSKQISVSFEKWSLTDMQELGRAGGGREGSLGYAVTLVGAFADIVIHLDYVEDFMVTFIAQVCSCALVALAFEIMMIFMQIFLCIGFVRSYYILAR